MPTSERNDQAEDQTMDETESPSSEDSNSSKAESKQIEQPGKAAVKKKTAKKVARKKAAKTADAGMGLAKKKPLQTSRKEVQNEESGSSAAKTKQIEPPSKVALRKKTVRKKVAKTAGGRVDSTKKRASQTSRNEVQNEESTSGKAETKQVEPPSKVTVKKTVRKKVAKTAARRTGSTRKRSAQASRKVIQAGPPAGSDPDTSVTGNSEAANVRPAAPNPPETPVEVSVRPAAAAAPPRPQPLPPGGTGLRGFWIKVGVSAVVMLAGIIGIYSFFSEDEATSGPPATQAAADADAQSEDASFADSAVGDTGTGRGAVIPPETEQSNVVYPGSLHRHSDEPGTFAGAAVANKPEVETAISAGVTPVTPSTDRAHANQRRTAAPPPQASRFAGESSVYRPELYRPLTPKEDPPPPTQQSTVSETPRNSFVPAPSYYPQPGAYPYPPAPYYGGYGRYYPY